MTDSTETPFLILIENVSDIFPLTSLSTRNAYILIRILELLKRSEKQEKNFLKATGTAKLIQNRGCAPLHKYALFMHLCAFYATFMHFSVDSIVIIQPPKWHIFPLLSCHFVTVSRARWPSKCFTQKAVKHITQDQRPKPQIVSRVKHS